MISYLIRRLLMMVPTLFGITLVVFVIINLAPGSPIEQRLQALRFAGRGGGDSGSVASGRNESGVTQGFSDLNVTGKIAWRPSSIVKAFEFLKANARATPKVTLPAPNCVHYYTGGKLGFYGNDAEGFWNDLSAAYRAEISALVAAGARYIQLDDTSIAFICDPQHREYVRSWGMDPEKLLLKYAEAINAVIAEVPEAVTITLHQCRGNREGNWAAQGGYDPVADVLFNCIDVDGYFLEYDTARAGGFEPLRLLAPGRQRGGGGQVCRVIPPGVKRAGRVG
jgi:5-methyltetrahydropteroyltriglutamate--homocysteine methyltransferase